VLGKLVLLFLGHYFQHWLYSVFPPGRDCHYSGRAFGPGDCAGAGQSQPVDFSEQQKESASFGYRAVTAPISASIAGGGEPERVGGVLGRQYFYGPGQPVHSDPVHTHCTGLGDLDRLYRRRVGSCVDVAGLGLETQTLNVFCFLLSLKS